MSLIPVSLTILQLAPEGEYVKYSHLLLTALFVSFCFRSSPFFNEQYIALTYYCTYLFLYANMFSHDTMQPYTLVRIIHQGLTTPHNMV